MSLALRNDSAALLKNAAFIPTRTALGASMLFHGYGKLAGGGPQQTGQMFEQLGIQPGKPWAVATGLAEVFAGAGAVLGLWTRPAALAVLVTQAVAIAKVHGAKGYDITKGGYEYNAALIAIALGLLLAGPGTYSGHEGLERLTEGRGARKLWSRARPSLASRILRLIK